MKFLSTLTILAIAPAIFAGEPVSNLYKLPVLYTGTDLACLTGKGALALSVPLPVIREFRNTQDPQPAPTVWSAGVYWDFRTKQTSAVVLRNIGQIKRPFNLTCDFDVDAFAGSDVQGNAVAGVGIGKSFNVAQNVVFKLEAAFTGSLEQKLGFGGILTITVRF